MQVLEDNCRTLALNGPDTRVRGARTAFRVRDPRGLLSRLKIWESVSIRSFSGREGYAQLFNRVT